MALDELPQNVEREAAIARAIFDVSGRRLYGGGFQAELEAGTRVVAQSASFVAFCPYASRFPYEVCIAHKSSASHSTSCKLANLSELAVFIREIIGRIEGGSGAVAYNYYLRPRPLTCIRAVSITGISRLFRGWRRWRALNGAPGCSSTPVSPEAAAAVLRGSPT